MNEVLKHLLVLGSILIASLICKHTCTHAFILYSFFLPRLEMELESRAIKGDFNPDTTKVIPPPTEENLSDIISRVLFVEAFNNQA